MASLGEMLARGAGGQEAAAGSVRESEIGEYVSIERVEQIMGLPANAISPVAWLVLQEESKGVSDEIIAKNLKVTESELQALRDSTTGKTGADSALVWLQGVTVLRASAILNERQIESGWDAIEAIAVDKIARNLRTMRTNGNLQEMLAVANAANKATRRARGEGMGRGGGGVNVSVNGGGAGVGVGLELKSGNLGTLKLTLSPAIQKQLSNPARVIDVTPKVVNPTKTAIGKLEMLDLKTVRDAVDSKAEADAAAERKSNAEVESNGMIFDLDL